jgi:transposase
MFIAEVLSKGKSGQSYTSILVRESVRVGSKVKSRTLAVLTHLPAHVIQAVRDAIAQPADSLRQVADHSSELQLRTGESFGAVWTVDQIARKLGIQKALGVTEAAELGYWQVLARVLRPRVSLLAMVRLAATCAAAALLGWRRAFTEDDLYSNGAWLEGRQAIIERRLWQQRPAHSPNQLFLYDVTSSYLEGSHNALAAWGYNRDGKKGRKQLVVGLLTDAQGEPISTQVYRGNTHDLQTFGDQVNKLKTALGCASVTMVGDRGLIKAEQQAAAQQAGFHFITALTKPQIRRLLKEKVLQMDLFDEEVCDVAAPKGERYVLRRNPVRQAELAAQRQAKQEALQAQARAASDYLARHPKAKVRTQEKKLSVRLKQLGVDKWLKLAVRGRRLILSVDAEGLRVRSQLDGCYVIQTDLPKAQAAAQTVHDRYKDLAQVERDFRTLKTGHLEFRPWYVCKEDNTRAHALTAMLALKVRRHLERAWEKLNLTVEEGLRELETLCVMELVHEQTGRVVTRQVPMPSARQKELLDALELELPRTLPEAKVTVGTRKKIQEERKALEK